MDTILSNPFFPAVAVIGVALVWFGLSYLVMLDDRATNRMTIDAQRAVIESNERTIRDLRTQIACHRIDRACDHLVASAASSR